MTTDISSNNKRIAKNVLFLYFRTIIVMLVNLYTSRIVLESLGVEDFGIYNVVGGIIVMISFVSSTLSTSSQRFITFELGKGEDSKIGNVFSTCLIMHIIMAVVVALIAEPVGLWFIYNKLLIPSNRLIAALWVFQFSIVSMVFMFVSVPYNALIVAHEKMNAFAAVSIFDAIMRLVIAYVIVLSSKDRLVLYAALILLSHILIQVCYMIYSGRCFKESKVKFIWDILLVKKIGKFALWSVMGNLAYVTYTQGLNLLLGTFFVPAVNAARSIAVQVQTAVNSFVNSFQTAINPQITKNYASNNITEMVNLVFCSSRFSFYLLMIMTLPILLEPEIILRLWLKNVPIYTVDFMRIILLTTWINSIANPLIISVKATGNVKMYELVVGGLMIAILPISYVFLRMDFPPMIVFFVHLCVECVAMMFRILITNSLINFSIKRYVKEVFLRILFVAILAIILPFSIRICMESGLTRFLIVCVVSFTSSSIAIFLFGLSKTERSFVKSKFSSLLQK